MQRRTRWWLPIALVLAPMLEAQNGCVPLAPCYTADGLVNSASGQSGYLAPYTFATLYGTNLSYNQRSGTTRPRIGVWAGGDGHFAGCRAGAVLPDDRSNRGGGAASAGLRDGHGRLSRPARRVRDDGADAAVEERAAGGAGDRCLVETPA